MDLSTYLLLLNSLAIKCIVIAAAAATDFILQEHNRDRRLLRPRASTREVINPGGPRAARLYINTLLREPDGSFFHLFRIYQDYFLNLCRWLRLNTELRPSRYQSLEQKVMIFLWACGHGESQRSAAYKFKISQSSVLSLFHELLEPMRLLHIAFVTQPDDSFVSPEIELCEKHYPFSGCISAIDGTHLAAHIPV